MPKKHQKKSSLFGVFLLLSGGSAFSATTTFFYGFSTDLEGWTNVQTSTTGSTQYSSLSGAGFAATTGNGLLPDPSNQLDGAGSVPLWVRSPEFSMSPSSLNAINFDLYGGRLGGASAPANDSAPTLTAATVENGGFQGMALRRVSDGAYLLMAGKSGDGPGAQNFSWDAATLNGAIAGNAPGETYTLDLIDEGHGGWGWIGADNVSIQAQSTITYTDGEDRTDSISTTTTTTLELATGTATQSGVISGVGAITKNGAGNLIFSGANTYTGATNINAGTLTISDGNMDALRNSAVTVASGATLLFDDAGNGFKYQLGSIAGAGTVDMRDGQLDVGLNSTSTTFSGAFTHDINIGDGDVEKRGSGTLTLTGSGHLVDELENFSGDVVIDGASGVFREVQQLSAGGSTTIRNVDATFELADLINSNGTVTVTGSGTELTVTSTLDNLSQLNISSGAQVTVSGDFIQDSGGTLTIDQASLIFTEFGLFGVGPGGGGSNSTGTIAISDATGGTALTVGTSSGISTFDGVIQDHTSGAGSVTKTGNSTVIFSGTNSFTGNFNLEAGTLVTDNLAGNLVQTGGIFSPGLSRATTTIGGDYSQSATSVLSLEIGGAEAGTEYDVLQIDGTADLSGTVNVTFTNGYIPSGGDTFRIFSAGSLIDNGYTLNPPVLLNDGLTVVVSATSSYIEVSVDFTENIFGFRAEFGLAEDGSDDFLDWSQNGIANIQYFAFGLGDPNEASVDRSRLPAVQNESAFGDYAITFVRPKTEVGITVSVETNADLTTGFNDLDQLGQSYQPVEIETESLDETYERITQHFDFVADETGRFYRVAVTITQEPAE